MGVEGFGGFTGFGGRAGGGDFFLLNCLIGMSCACGMTNSYSTLSFNLEMS